MLMIADFQTKYDDQWPVLSGLCLCENLPAPLLHWTAHTIISYKAEDVNLCHGLRTLQLAIHAWHVGGGYLLMFFETSTIPVVQTYRPESLDYTEIVIKFTHQFSSISVC